MPIHPRYAILSILVSFSPAAVCSSQVQDENAVMEVPGGQAIVNALISDPAIGERLKADGLTVGRMTRRILQPGVTEYVLYVHTCAMCNPAEAKTGFVTITEDVRPTYADGAIEYSVSFSIENADR